MFGCGKFDEERFLLFIEGKVDKEIDEHLKTCPNCLKEFIELNRINALSDSFKPEKTQKVIILKSIKDKITSFFTNFDSGKIVSSGVMGEEKKTEILMTESFPFLIKVSKNEGYFCISIVNREKKPFDIEIKRINESIPFFMKTNSTDEVTISNLKGEKYILNINEREILLNLIDGELYEN
ncbi:MAG: hypothetical protein N2258_02155 [Brevinematales bacterium]|nr:hypothetical protein [Brevinematales bacterium]